MRPNEKVTDLIAPNRDQRRSEKRTSPDNTHSVSRKTLPRGIAGSETRVPLDSKDKLYRETECLRPRFLWA